VGDRDDDRECHQRQRKEHGQGCPKPLIRRRTAAARTRTAVAETRTARGRIR
jgi:hypothetical protein